MRTSELFGAKNFGFFKIYGVSARTRVEGLSQCRHFSDKERDQFFAILRGRLLWTAPNIYIIRLNQCSISQLKILYHVNCCSKSIAFSSHVLSMYYNVRIYQLCCQQQIL